MLDTINAIAWVLSNALVAYIAVILMAFITCYYVLFDPSATTAGKMIFRFMLSLVGVIGLVVVGTFIDPTNARNWTHYPGDVAQWRPILRLVVYSFVAFTITSLSVSLVIRKWKPHLVKKASDLDLVIPRHDTDTGPTHIKGK